MCKFYEYFHCKKSSTIILQSSFHLSRVYNISCNSSRLNKYKKSQIFEILYIKITTQIYTYIYMYKYACMSLKKNKKRLILGFWIDFWGIKIKTDLICLVILTSIEFSTCMRFHKDLCRRFTLILPRLSEWTIKEYSLIMSLIITFLYRNCAEMDGKWIVIHNFVLSFEFFIFGKPTVYILCFSNFSFSRRAHVSRSTCMGTCRGKYSVNML